MKKSTMWAGMVGIMGAVALAGCQGHDDAASKTADTNAPVTQPAAAPETPATPVQDNATVPAAAPTTTDAGNNAALPSDQSDDMSNMNSSDTAKPSTLPDSQSGTAEDNR